MYRARSSRTRQIAIGGAALAAATALVSFGITTAADHDEAPLVRDDQAADTPWAV